MLELTTLRLLFVAALLVMGVAIVLVGLAMQRLAEGQVASRAGRDPSPHVPHEAHTRPSQRSGASRSDCAPGWNAGQIGGGNRASPPRVPGSRRHHATA